MLCYNRYYEDLGSRFGSHAYGRFGRTWRWRMLGYALMMTSTVVALTAYWKIAKALGLSL